MRLRGRLHLGPALRRLRLPVKSTVVSVVFHAAFAGAVLWGNAVWGDSQSKPVIVNLVPAIAAVGAPQGRPEMPPRAEEPTPPRPIPTDLPRREASRDLPARELPARDLPARDLPDQGVPPGAPGRHRGQPVSAAAGGFQEAHPDDRPAVRVRPYSDEVIR